MKLSADPNSPYFNDYAFAAKAYLDGVELRGCITADDEAGECECFVMGESGYPIKDTDNSFMREIRRGKVEIKIPTDDEIEEQNRSLQ